MRRLLAFYDEARPEAAKSPSAVGRSVAASQLTEAQYASSGGMCRSSESLKMPFLNTNFESLAPMLAAHEDRMAGCLGYGLSVEPERCRPERQPGFSLLGAGREVMDLTLTLPARPCLPVECQAVAL